MNISTLFKQSLLTLSIGASMLFSGVTFADPAVDIAINKSVSTNIAAPGESITYTIEYENAGTVNIPANIAVIKDFADTSDLDLSSLAFISVPNGDICSLAIDPDPLVAIFQGQYIQCSLSGLAPGEKRVLTYSLTIKSTATVGNDVLNIAYITTDNEDAVNKVNNTSTVTVQINSTVSTPTPTPVVDHFADLVVTKTVNKSTAQQNEVIEYSILVINNGNLTAENVIIKDLFDNKNLQLSEYGGDTLGNCEITVDPDPLVAIFQGEYISCSNFSLIPGQSLEFNISGYVSDTAILGTIIRNNVTVSTTTPESNITNNSANVSTTVIAGTGTGSDLSITKTSNISEVPVGGEVEYTISITNTGDLEADNVWLQDFSSANKFDLSTLVYSGIDSNSCVITQDPDPLVAIFQGGHIECIIGNIAGGATKTFSYTVHLSPASQAGETITNVARVQSGNETGPDTNNSASANVLVIDTTETADMSIVKSVTPETASVGDTVTYTLTYTNEGTLPSQNVIIKDLSNKNELDLTTLNFTAIPNGDTCGLAVDPDPLVAIFQGQFIKCTIGTVNGGDTGVITYTLTLKNSTVVGTTVLNVATITSTSVDNNPVNNSAVASLRVVETSTPTPTATPTPTQTPTSTPTPVIVTATPLPTVNPTHNTAVTSSSSSGSNSGSGGGCNTYAIIDLDIKAFIQLENGEFIDANSLKASAMLAKNSGSTVTYKVIILNKGTVYAEKTKIDFTFASKNGLSQSDITNIKGAELQGKTFVIKDAVAANGSKSFTFSAKVVSGNSGSATATFSITDFTADFRCPKLKESKGIGQSDTIYLHAGDVIIPTKEPQVVIIPKQIISTSEISRSTLEAYRLTKVSNKSEVYPGDEIEFIISIKNTGAQDLKNVMLFDIFPKEYLEPIGATANKLVDPETLKFKRKFLPRGDTFSATVKMRVKSDLLAGTTITNLLKAGSQTIEMKEEASVQIQVLSHQKAAIKPRYIPTSQTASLIGPTRLVQTGTNLPLIPLGLALFFIGIFIYRRKQLL